MAPASLKRLTYRYPGAREAALREVTLEIEPGITVVAGPSGGGKSTLLRVLNGLVPHFHGGTIAGSATAGGLDIIATPTRRLAQTVGFVFQDPELQTVYDPVEREIGFGLENAGVDARDIPRRVAAAMVEVGIEHLAGRRMRTLSGGERQRVALAAAMVVRPRVVALDEPTSQLDPAGAALLLDALVGLARDGRAIVVAEHSVDRLIASACRLVMVDAGRIAATRPESWTEPPRAPRPARAGAPTRIQWSLDAVSAGFGDHMVLEGVDLAGRAGEVTALSGPNGAGKTTLLRIIAGVLVPAEGRVHREPGRIAYLTQNPAAILHLPTVRSEVELTLRRARETDRPQAIIDELGLERLADRYPRDLSSGQRQRAALAAVLAGRPALVLLDEPTRGMDEHARTALIHLIARLRDCGAAIVLATHDRALRDAVADRTFEVAAGHVREVVGEAVAS